MVETSVRTGLVAELERAGAAVLTPDEAARLYFAAVDLQTQRFKSHIIGRNAAELAAWAHIQRPYPIQLLVVPTGAVAATNYLAAEKLTRANSRWLAAFQATPVSTNIGHAGNARLRTALYMATLSAARHNPLIRAQYERLRAAGKPTKLARCATARKLTHLAYAVVTKGERFDPDYPARGMTTP